MEQKEIQLPATQIPFCGAWKNRPVIFEFIGHLDQVNELLVKAKTAGVPVETYPQNQSNKKDRFKLTVNFERSQFAKFVNFLMEKKDLK